IERGRKVCCPYGLHEILMIAKFTLGLFNPLYIKCFQVQNMVQRSKDEERPRFPKVQEEKPQDCRNREFRVDRISNGSTGIREISTETSDLEHKDYESTG